MEPRKWAVWQVFGYSRGTVRLLHEFPFASRTAADELASTIDAGYVLRGIVFAPMPFPVKHATGDTRQSSKTAPSNVSDQSTM